MSGAIQCSNNRWQRKWFLLYQMAGANSRKISNAHLSKYIDEDNLTDYLGSFGHHNNDSPVISDWGGCFNLLLLLYFMLFYESVPVFTHSKSRIRAKSWEVLSYISQYFFHEENSVLNIKVRNIFWLTLNELWRRENITRGDDYSSSSILAGRKQKEEILVLKRWALNCKNVSGVAGDARCIPLPPIFSGLFVFVSLCLRVSSQWVYLKSPRATTPFSYFIISFLYYM